MMCGAGRPHHLTMRHPGRAGIRVESATPPHETTRGSRARAEALPGPSGSALAAQSSPAPPRARASATGMVTGARRARLTRDACHGRDVPTHARFFSANGNAITTVVCTLLREEAETHIACDRVTRRRNYSGVISGWVSFQQGGEILTFPPDTADRARHAPTTQASGVVISPMVFQHRNVLVGGESRDVLPFQTLPLLRGYPYGVSTP